MLRLSSRGTSCRRARACAAPTMRQRVSFGGEEACLRAVPLPLIYRLKASVGSVEMRLMMRSVLLAIDRDPDAVEKAELGHDRPFDRRLLGAYSIARARSFSIASWSYVSMAQIQRGFFSIQRGFHAERTRFPCAVLAVPTRIARASLANPTPIQRPPPRIAHSRTSHSASRTAASECSPCSFFAHRFAAAMAARPSPYNGGTQEAFLATEREPSIWISFS